jgi:hypothetical protein
MVRNPLYRFAGQFANADMRVLLLLDDPPEESRPSRNESDVLILQIPRVLANSMNNLSMNKESITSPLLQALANALHGQSFFTTRSGYIGVGPGRTQAGDQMFVQTGGAWVFILRGDQGSAYALVAWAYVHGVMDGQLEDLFKRGEKVGPQAQEFRNP